MASLHHCGNPRTLKISEWTTIDTSKFPAIICNKWVEWSSWGRHSGGGGGGGGGCDPSSCFTNVWRALQDVLSKFVYCRNHTSYENFKLKLCTWAQSHALGTRAKFQLGILIINVVSGIVYFRDIILESTQNVSETSPWNLKSFLVEVENPFIIYGHYHSYWRPEPWFNIKMSS